MAEAVEKFWQAFVAATGIEGAYTAWYFGDSAEQATELALLVRDGPKRATAGLAPPPESEEPPARVGDLSVILDGKGEPVCVIRTTQVQVRRFGDVDAAFAAAEGEGDGSLEYWRREHARFFRFEGAAEDEDTPVQLEHFELLWAP